MLEGNEETSSYHFTFVHHQEEKVGSLSKILYFVKSNVLDILMHIFEMSLNSSML